MFEKLGNFFNKMMKPEVKELTSKDAAKERLHLVLMQDRANVSVDFLELMKQEILDVIKKYIVVDENAIDVRLTNQENSDGTNGAPSLYANIPILNIKNDVKAEKIKDGTLMYENGELEKTPTPEVIEMPETVEELEFVPEEINEEFSEEAVVLEENIEQAENEIPETEIIEENNEVEDKQEEIEISSEEIIIEKEEVEEAIEPVVDFSEDEELDDEDGEDITFDDLLKKAEEEEANNSENSAEKKSSSKKKKANKKKKR